MTSPIDTQYVLADPDIQPYYKDESHDLSATGVEKIGNAFVIFKEKVPKTQVLVVKGIVPYLMERTDVGTANESAAYISPVLVERFVTFEPYINDNSPHIIDNTFTQFQTQASPPSDLIKERARGFSAVSNEPYATAVKQWFSTLYTFVVRGNAELKITFRLLPVGAGFKTFSIGSGPKRIDYAGVVVVGMRMPEQLYNSMIEQKRRERNA